MASEGVIHPEFVDFDLDPTVPNGHHTCKQEKQLSASPRRHFSLCRRKAFAALVSSKKTSDGDHWCCCGQTFSQQSFIHKHVARCHQAEVEQAALRAFEMIHREPEAADPEPVSTDLSSWIPDTSHLSVEQLTCGPGRVLLYYCYTDVADPHAVCAWQQELCEKLHLKGKVRVASEGINGTVGGSCVSTELYIDALCSSSVFLMSREDFKISDGGAQCFLQLRVGVYKEIVPMGVDPHVLSYRLAGTHLEPEEFHREVGNLLREAESSSETVLLDCRNFYESKIGQFTRCLAPNIRKFSYFPDYVDQNLDLFWNKRVLMYCTGGIRCERASAYLRTKDVCKDVLQLRGGIHKYLEQFPEGHYRGKLFVFDERFAISSNDDVISDCRYCGVPWDGYELCSSSSCRQLVLSCPSCRNEGLTACCPTCQSKGHDCSTATTAIATTTTALPQKEECECTATRPRIPLDVPQTGPR